jgi:hypothetical protein
MRGKKNSCTVLVEKPEGKKSLERRRHKGKDTIKMCPKETE